MFFFFSVLGQQVFLLENVGRHFEVVLCLGWPRIWQCQAKCCLSIYWCLKVFVESKFTPHDVFVKLVFVRL